MVIGYLFSRMTQTNGYSNVHSVFDRVAGQVNERLMWLQTPPKPHPSSFVFWEITMAMLLHFISETDPSLLQLQMGNC